VPWVHFVPVKHDLSDLIEKIEWLINNDEKAEEIANNGRSLYKKLYNIPNMIEDAASMYKRYAELMKYSPTVPSSKFLWKSKKWDYETKTVVLEENKDDEEDEEFEEDEENEDEKDEL
jgi:hypothetical protein